MQAGLGHQIHSIKLINYRLKSAILIQTVPTTSTGRSHQGWRAKNPKFDFEWTLFGHRREMRDL